MSNLLIFELILHGAQRGAALPTALRRKLKLEAHLRGWTKIVPQLLGIQKRALSLAIPVAQLIFVFN
jgi:hypothetical protein